MQALPKDNTPSSRSSTNNYNMAPQLDHSLFRADPTAFALVESTLLRYQQSQQQQHGQQMPSQAHGIQSGAGSQEAAASALPAPHAPYAAPQRRRLSLDESMAAAGLFVLAQATEQDVGGARGNSQTGAAAAANKAPTGISRSTRLPHRESGKINDGLQPPILTRDAILQHQIPKPSGAQEKLQLPPKKSALSSSTLPLSAKTLAGSNNKLIGSAVSSAVMHQQPHHPGVYNNFLSPPAQHMPVTKTDELLQLHTNQQLLLIIQKRRMEEMLRRASIAAAAIGQPHSQPLPQLQPPSKRIKINPPVPSASSASPGQRKAPKKRILARRSEDHVSTTPKVHIDRQQLSLAPEEETDPLTGDLINTVQDYYPHEDGGEGTTVPRAKVFMSSHLGRAAAPQSGYGTLPSWRLAKRQLTESSSPSSSPSSNGDAAHITKMRSKISALIEKKIHQLCSNMKRPGSLAKALEARLFASCSSLDEYSNLSTLERRLRDVSMVAGRSIEKTRVKRKIKNK